MRASFSEAPEPRGNRFHLGVQRTLTDGGSNGYASGAGQDSSQLFPITLSRIGRNEGRLTFYVESEAVRKDWATKLVDAFEQHTQALRKSQVVELVPLAEQTFGCSSTIGSLVPAAPAEKMLGNPTCSAPLTAADGQPLIVAGCAQGKILSCLRTELFDLADPKSRSLHRIPRQAAHDEAGRAPRRHHSMRHPP